MNILKPHFEILYLNREDINKIEYAARTCYKSEEKMDGSLESSIKLIKRLVDSGHEAMLEHAYISVKFICDRGVSHEIVRHRLGSYAQESTRYCNYSKDKFDGNVNFIDISNALPKDMDEYTRQRTLEIWFDSIKQSEKSYLSLTGMGVPPEIARAVLPNSLKTEIVVTANYREWRHILSLRAAGTTGKPHPQMEELMLPLLDYFYKEIPVVFDDIWEKAYSEKGFNYDQMKDELVKPYSNGESCWRNEEA